jgi:hypothetical protein
MSAALEINPLLRSQQFYVIINTVVSLLGSCMSTFAVSALISNKCALGMLPETRNAACSKLPLLVATHTRHDASSIASAGKAHLHIVRTPMLNA